MTPETKLVAEQPKEKIALESTYNPEALMWLVVLGLPSLLIFLILNKLAQVG